MSQVANQSAWITPPTLGEPVVAATSATAGVVDLTALAEKGQFITVQADGAKTYILFGLDATVQNAIDPTATSGTGQCMFIAADDERAFKLDKDGPFFLAFRTVDPDVGYIRVTASSPRGSRRE